MEPCVRCGKPAPKLIVIKTLHLCAMCEYIINKMKGHR